MTAITAARRAEIVEQVVELTRVGLSARQIAQRINVSERYVVRVRVNAGVAQNRSRALTDDELARAKSLLDDGAGYNETARTLGCCHDTLRQRFPGMGLSTAETRERQAIGRREAEINRRESLT